MLLKLLPVFMLILGIGAGVGAALVLSPTDELGTEDARPGTERKPADIGRDETDTEFVKLNNQFVIPVIEDEKVASLVVLSLSIETRIPMRDVVYEREPRLRDAFLQVLFDHANMGGFNGAFTKSDMLSILRNSLNDVARKELGADVQSVLITDITRQDS
ncbi:flagellar basal body-associated FliL family protein [Sedimentitalea sp. JM2-8]|uniref:Flagellar protein FliL n=1 Tax=Sedimentitalea xiamensis TaxID=3050037 RepID=A0ABT7F9A6_9RHOB|nr:flagellar basal body-associated FliL family protein [Sedimentitalea xiamensis]MDK3071696.1 flagellar basal body-associated FliL family protein [Sedimentitalea xiamensis]